MILVTGASGLLGANLVLALQDRQAAVIGTYLNHPIYFNGRAVSIRCNLTDRNQARAMIAGLRPEWIIHCAAATDVDWCQENPQSAWQINVEATRHLADAACEYGAHLIYISTDSVFGGKVGHYSTDDQPNPINVYAKTKLAGEQSICHRASSGYLIIRTNFYGWNAQDKFSLAEWILSKLEAGEEVPGFYDVVFTPILVNDLADVVLRLMAFRASGIWHVAGAEPCSKYAFAKRVALTFGHDPALVEPVSIDDSNLHAARPRCTSLAVSKVSRALGIRMPCLASGLERFKALRESGFAARLKGLMKTQCK